MKKEAKVVMGPNLGVESTSLYHLIDGMLYTLEPPPRVGCVVVASLAIAVTAAKEADTLISQEKFMKIAEQLWEETEVTDQTRIVETGRA